MVEIARRDGVGKQYVSRVIRLAFLAPEMVERNLIDVVVVYKVDRLTRSLADFAKMVEIFYEFKRHGIAEEEKFARVKVRGLPRVGPGPCPTDGVCRIRDDQCRGSTS